MTILETLADYVCGASVARLPVPDRETLRLHAADAAIAYFAGQRTPEAAALRGLDPQARGFEAVATAAAIVRHTEIDDIHLTSCTTPSSVAVPTALLLADQAGETNVERVESAIMVGTELVVRLGIAIDGPTILYRGIWPTCIAAPLGAAAVAARIWGLKSQQTVHALSLASMMTAGRTGRFHGGLPGRWILFMAAIAAGLRAARAAEAGFAGDPALLDGSWLANAQGLQAELVKLTGNLGETSVLPELSMKPFCTARQALSPTEALIELLDEGLDPRAIDKIVVRVPRAYAGMIAQRVDPNSRSSGFVSAGFQMGIAAFRRDHLWDLDRSEVMQDPQVHAFAQKVQVEPNPLMDSDFPRRWPATIDVSSSGRIVQKTVEIAQGDAEKPLDAAAFEVKAHRLLDPLFGALKGKEVMTIAMAGFENSRACRALMDLMATAQG